MCYLKRKIDSFLTEWKATPRHKPLIIKGPRQVGKTESVRRFAESSYENVIYINFVEEPKYKLITADGYKTDEIIKNISRLDPGKRFLPGKTLLFFDELQEFPDIATALKFFSIDGRFDVICSGSMLGINYRKIESNSVGYKTDYEMYSMDFEEFLWAKDYDDGFIADLLSHMRTLTPFSELELSVCNSLFLDHCSGTQLDAVAAMQQLNTLEIHRFSTKVESLSSLTVLSNLVSLHLHDVAVNGNIEALFGIPSLKSLHLDGCRVGINFARLPVNENLEILSMNGIRITDGSETEGEGGKNGDEIRLSEHYEMFDCFPNLTELYLESLGLEDIAFTGRLPHLRHLDVRDNPVASLKELQGLEEIRTVWYGGGTIVFP